RPSRSPPAREVAGTAGAACGARGEANDREGLRAVAARLAARRAPCLHDPSHHRGRARGRARVPRQAQTGMAGTMTTTPIDHRVEIAEAVATITLARPQAYNALTADLLDSLLATFRALERDAAVRAIVLTGEGKGFCAGQALDDARTIPPDRAPDLGTTLERRYGPLVEKILTIEKPVIAAVNGVAAGAGMGLACACDFRIVAETASFTTAFVKIGLVPDSGLSFTLPRLVGYGKALELCMLSEKIDAVRANALGLCTKLVAADRCLVEA